ncbi:MAG TPA: glutamate racemase [Methylomirabilota bacterium]|jgi:glutamate racemase|nr:glutamate racemase [Methylomirabilota bacterium]
MKIGIFDSGLGGLFILRALTLKLPTYDYIFLGDTKNLPYGEKSDKEIFDLSVKAVKFLFEQGCSLVIIACNTSSAQALREIQRDYLPEKFPDRHVLGVIRPTIEEINTGDTIVLATTFTAARARVYSKELEKIHPELKVTEIAAPELAAYIEANDLKKIRESISKYTLPLKDKVHTNLILGCTHYAVVKNLFAKKLGKGVRLISQDEIIPEKLSNYLVRHAEIERNLSKKGERTFFVTKLDEIFTANAKKWFGKKVELKLAKY